MPFRSTAVRAAEDVKYLRGPGYGLDEGEWIAYWAVFPHSLTGKVTSAATEARIDPATRMMIATFDPGVAALMKVALGIVDWHLLDKDGTPVPWEPDRARELVDGLPTETFTELQRIVSTTEEAPDLGAPTDPEEPRSETAGNDSGGSSPPS